VIRSGSETVDDGGVEFVRVGKMEVKSAATPESFGAQGALVEATRRVEDKCVVLEFAMTGGGEHAV